MATIRTVISMLGVAAWVAGCAIDDHPSSAEGGFLSGGVANLAAGGYDQRGALQTAGCGSLCRARRAAFEAAVTEARRAQMERRLAGAVSGALIGGVIGSLSGGRDAAALGAALGAAAPADYVAQVRSQTASAAEARDRVLADAAADAARLAAVAREASALAALHAAARQDIGRREAAGAASRREAQERSAALARLLRDEAFATEAVAEDASALGAFYADALAALDAPAAAAPSPLLQAGRSLDAARKAQRALLEQVAADAGPSLRLPCPGPGCPAAFSGMDLPGGAHR